MMAEPTVDTSDPANVVSNLAAAGSANPTARDEMTGTLIVLRYREVDRLAHDRRMAGVGLTWFDLMGIDGRLREWYGGLMFTNEGDGHTRMRRLVSRAFTPRSIDHLRSWAGSVVEEVYAGIESGGRGDLADGFARLGTRVMCRLLGVPQDDVAVFGRWADALSPIFGFMDPVQIEEAAEALDGLLAYTSDLVDRRDREPGDDLITALLRAEHEGDRLSRGEVVTMVANLLVAAHDTTASQLGCGLLTLLGHPGAVERIRSGEVGPGDAVTETMRYEPAIPLFPRTVTAPLEIGGVERPAGTMVLLAVAAANRDREVYDRPETFDVGRFQVPQVPLPLSFGSGPHYCLGANLARMAMEEAVAGLARRDLRLAPDAGPTEWRTVLGRSPVRLPVVA